MPKARKITIKKNKNSNITKFKLRTPKYLITLKVDGKDRAEKIKQSIPADLTKESIEKKKSGSKWDSNIKMDNTCAEWLKDFRMKNILRVYSFEPAINIYFNSHISMIDLLDKYN